MRVCEFREWAIVWAREECQETDVCGTLDDFVGGKMEIAGVEGMFIECSIILLYPLIIQILHHCLHNHLCSFHSSVSPAYT